MQTPQYSYRRASPTSEGFRALFRAPDAYGAEVLWRWLWGFISILIASFTIREILHAVTITRSENFAIRSAIPSLIVPVVGRIIRDLVPLVFRESAIVLVAVSIAWIFAGALGRSFTTRRMLEFFDERYSLEPIEAPLRFRTMLMLHFLRVVIAIAVGIGYIGAALIASKAAELIEPPSVLIGALVFFFGLALVLASASWVNWIVSLAPIFAVRDERDTLGSLHDALDFYATTRGRLAGTGLWLALLRTVAAIAISTVAFIPFGFASLVPGWVIWLLLGLITLVYFLISDALLVVRLGAYVAIAEQERIPAPEPPLQPVAAPALSPLVFRPEDLLG